MKRNADLKTGQLLTSWYVQLVGLHDVETRNEEKNRVFIPAGEQLIFLGEEKEWHQSTRTNGRYTSYLVRYIKVLSKFGPVWVDIVGTKKVRGKRKKGDRK